MSNRLYATIYIGGRLTRARVPELLAAIARANVTLHPADWGGLPQTVEELMAALNNKHLVLFEEPDSINVQAVGPAERPCRDLSELFAPAGELPELEALCRELNLSFTRFSQTLCSRRPQQVDWRPGMAEVQTRTAFDSFEGQFTFVPSGALVTALQHLQAGRVAQAISVLRAVCPDVPELPPLEIT